VLSFSLDTAERSLEETLPHVVLKLVEGRTKRLRVLEQSAQEKRRELEQRSAETCAVSSTHLETFRMKAEGKCEEAMEVYAQVLDSLLMDLRTQAKEAERRSGAY